MDDNYKILAINAKHSGQTNDSAVWRTSDIKQFISRKFHGKHWWLIGDSGYPLEPHLLVPFRVAGLREEILYNNAFTKLRCAVERAIGELSGKILYSNYKFALFRNKILIL